MTCRCLTAAVYGAGGHARVIASILRARGTDILGFFDDSYKGEELIQGKPLLGVFRDILTYQKSIAAVYIALGNNQARCEAFSHLKKNEFTVPALVHPSAIVEQDAAIGDGAVICLGAILGTEVRIGQGTLINSGGSIDHEVRIGDFSHLAPGTCVAGRTSIGSNTFIGINSSIGDRLSIGDNVIIGAGSVILKDVPDGAKIAGVYH
jgi:sugar O-acyltransferase (sialic acid O-acetyltransferase NeuD family)